MSLLPVRAMTSKHLRSWQGTQSLHSCCKIYIEFLFEQFNSLKVRTEGTRMKNQVLQYPSSRSHQGSWFEVVIIYPETAAKESHSRMRCLDQFQLSPEKNKIF